MNNPNIAWPNSQNISELEGRGDQTPSNILTIFMHGTEHCFYLDKTKEEATRLFMIHWAESWNPVTEEIHGLNVIALELELFDGMGWFATASGETSFIEELISSEGLDAFHKLMRSPQE